MKPGRVSLVALSLLLGGCLLVAPHVIRGIDAIVGRGHGASGIEYYRHEGATAAGSPLRVSHYLDLGAKRRYVVTWIDGEVFMSSWEDMHAEIGAALAAYGSDASGRSEAEVLRRLGPPSATSAIGDVRVLWYARSRRDAVALIFEASRFVAAFRTDEAEMECLLKHPSTSVERGGAPCAAR